MPCTVQLLPRVELSTCQTTLNRLVRTEPLSEEKWSRQTFCAKSTGCRNCRRGWDTCRATMGLAAALLLLLGLQMQDQYQGALFQQRRLSHSWKTWKRG